MSLALLRFTITLEVPVTATILLKKEIKDNQKDNLKEIAFIKYCFYYLLGQQVFQVVSIFYHI